MMTLEQLNDEVTAAQKAGNFALSVQIATRYFYKAFYGKDMEPADQTLPSAGGGANTGAQ